jgi:hypothetical protein
MENLPPYVSRFLAWLSVILLGAIVTVGWWRLTEVSSDLRELDRRVTRVEAKAGIAAEPKQQHQQEK